MFRRNWVKTTGRVLDSRIRGMYRTRHSSIPLHNYIVEFQAPNGDTTRLEVKQTIQTVRVGVGSEVPLLVSPDGKKAIFDKKDPRINVNAVNQAHKESDEERFRRQLQGE